MSSAPFWVLAVSELPQFRASFFDLSSLSVLSESWLCAVLFLFQSRRKRYEGALRLTQTKENFCFHHVGFLILNASFRENQCMLFSLVRKVKFVYINHLEGRGARYVDRSLHYTLKKERRCSTPQKFTLLLLDFSFGAFVLPRLLGIFLSPGFPTSCIIMYHVCNDPLN